MKKQVSMERLLAPLAVLTDWDEIGFPTLFYVNENDPKFRYVCFAMKNQISEDWKRTCLQAAGEDDPEKLLELTRKLIELLEKRKQSEGRFKLLSEFIN
jgi:hypothetical protein